MNSVFVENTENVKYICDMMVNKMTESVISIYEQ